ncbi:MAG: hypothetical protein IT289_01805 [Oligoflexia bacterium]|nr:hypothetical protein [Oligoflexia bacterium]
MEETIPKFWGTLLFGLAVLHTFLAPNLRHLERFIQSKLFKRFWHWLTEPELSFAIWSLVLMIILGLTEGPSVSLRTITRAHYTEAYFVLIIVLVTSTRPILMGAELFIAKLARLLPINKGLGHFFVLLTFGTLLGSLITEPAAITLVALLLGRGFFKNSDNILFKYSLVGTLLVNISVGGLLTPYAAPPVLMVARTWGWDLSFMLQHFGWKAALICILNTILLTLVFRREIKNSFVSENLRSTFPPFLIAIHLILLLAIIWAHQNPWLLTSGLVALFILHKITERHQEPLRFQLALPVASFLAGLIYFGPFQSWWVMELSKYITEGKIFWGSMTLTAVLDNAALTYLGTLIPTLDDRLKYLLVAGAVTGGGLTIIANAPNPAGIAILQRYFPDSAIDAGKLFFFALFPTLVAAGCLLLL